MQTALNRMGSIRLFPLLFQSGCSQSSRFLPQARRIVGFGDENGFSPDLGGKNGGVLSMRMQVILDSSYARPGSAPIYTGLKERRVQGLDQDRHKRRYGRERPGTDKLRETRNCV